MKNIQDYEAELRLAVAFNKSNTKTLIEIVKKNGNIDAPGTDNLKTPLHLAAETRNDSILDLLLEAGADPTLKDKNNKTPLNLYLEQQPQMRECDTTTRCINTTPTNTLPTNTLEQLIKSACTKLSEKGLAKKYFTVTHNGDFISEDDPMKILLLTQDAREEMYQAFKTK